MFYNIMINILRPFIIPIHNLYNRNKFYQSKIITIPLYIKYYKKNI